MEDQGDTPTQRETHRPTQSGNISGNQQKYKSDGNGNGDDNDGHELGSDRKGKGRLSSATDRLQASGRLALNTVTTGHSLTGTLVATGKGSSGHSDTQWPSTKPGEASSQRTYGAAANESLRAVHDGQASTRAFHTFTDGPHTQLAMEGTGKRVTTSSFAEQEAMDGSAVVQLLGRPDCAAGPEPPSDSDFLSPAAAERLREALFSPTANRPVWDGLLNFTPDFIARPQGFGGGAEKYLGTTDAAVAKSIWIQQWGDVLSAYNEDVWGDLGTLAAEARSEVNQLVDRSLSDDKKPEAQALGRLSLILAHLRGGM